MEKKNVTLRLPVDMVEYLDRGEGINQGVKDVVDALRRHEKYADMEIRGKFTPNEWEFLVDSLNGSLALDDFRFSASALVAHIQDAELYDGTASRWDVSVDCLTEKIKEMSAAQIEAVYRRVERFWKDSPDIEAWAEY